MRQEIDLAHFIVRLREAIGSENVVADPQLLEVLSRTCIPYRELPSVIVYPTSIEQVQKVVHLANEFKIPIWPVSTGKNWGYGEQTACYPHGITMILNRMTKIWHVDEKLGYAVIDPGVTYQHLNDYLKKNQIKLWADVSGSTQSGSVIGNALDKGRGVTPYADHFGSLCGMDVVLPNGELLETGGGPQGNNHARHVYKWGLGPYLDGIFAQSNYGVVVKAGVWLMPEPEVFDWAVFEYHVGPEKFGDLIDDMRELVFSGAMRARPHLANDFAMMCIVSQYPHDLLSGKRCLSDEAMAVWRKKHGVARFTFGCGLYGSKTEVRFQKKHLGRVLGKYGMVQFLGAAVNDDFQGRMLRFLAPFINRLMGKSQSFVAALVPGINLFRGIPTDFFAKQVYFKNFKQKPSDDVIDPAKDQCGFLWIGPLIPFISDHIVKAVDMSKAISAKYEFDYFLEVIIESPRAVIFLLGVFYDRNDDADAIRAKAWYAETRDTFLKNGYPAYRTTTMSMATSLENNVVTKKILESIKYAIDPDNVIAPGRYGIMPRRDDQMMEAGKNEIVIKEQGTYRVREQSSGGANFEGSYLKTGDIGYFDEDGFPYFDGDKFEEFRTAAGRKIPVIELDLLFKTVPYIEMAITLGENRIAPIMLVSLDFQELAGIMGLKVDELRDKKDGCFNTAVLERISRDLSEKNSELPEKMRCAGFIVIAGKFVFEEQEVTSNIKIRRRYIEKRLTPTLDKLYLDIDSNPKIYFWVFDSQDLKLSPKADNRIRLNAMARLSMLVSLLIEVMATRVTYHFMSKPQNVLYRKLGQIFRYRLGRLRGPLQKFGQMLSYLHEDLPEDFREEVRDLLRDSPSVSPSLIRSIVEAELKQPISSIFSEWRDAPLYTASISQVHFARLMSGEAVAVKVLLPNMDKIVKSDLFLLKICAPLIGIVMKNREAKKHFEELKQLILRECDLLAEADNMEIFRMIFRENPHVIIPQIHKNLCTPKVLVTTYIDGKTIEQFIKSSDTAGRRQVLDTIWRFHCEAINRYAIFNADPHPGNYIVCGDKVAFLDFGFCKRWDPHFIDLWKKQTLAGCRNDEEGFIKATKAMGLDRPGDHDYIKNLFPVYRDIFYRPWMKDGEFKITHPYVKLYVKTMFEKVVMQGNVHVPTEFLALTRLFFAKFALMAELDADYNYYRGTMPYIEGETLSYRDVKTLVRPSPVPQR